MINIILIILGLVFWYPIFYFSYVFFIFSAIALSDVVMTLSIPLLLVSRNLFRKLTNKISFAGWPLITLAFETLGKNKIIFTGEDLVSAQKKDKNALVTLNHTYHCDWLLAFSLGERVGRIGNIKIAMKDVIKYIPFVGIGIWAMGFIFLSRRWQDDQHKINKAYSHLRSDGEPFWFVTHPEGSRVNAKNLQDCQKFAKERGGNIPILNNLLLPRLKGFVSSVIALRDCTDAVYDLTAAYKKRPASFLSLFYGNNPTEIHVHLRRFDMKSLPQSEEEIGVWLYERYKEKDALLDHFKEKGHFPGEALNHMKFNASKYAINLVFWIVSVLSFMYFSVDFFKIWFPILNN